MEETKQNDPKRRKTTRRTKPKLDVDYIKRNQDNNPLGEPEPLQSLHTTDQNHWWYEDPRTAFPFTEHLADSDWVVQMEGGGQRTQQFLSNKVKGEEHRSFKEVRGLKLERLDIPLIQRNAKDLEDTIKDPGIAGWEGAKYPAEIRPILEPRKQFIWDGDWENDVFIDAVDLLVPSTGGSSMEESV